MTTGRHRAAGRIVATAWLVAASWALLALLIVQFAAAYVYSENTSWFLSGDAFILILFCFIALAATYLVLALSLQCEACGRRFLVEDLGPKHPSATRLLGMDRWASAILGILRRGQCTCMYCGAHIATKP